MTQLRLAAAGKSEMYDAAATTFETFLKNHPRSRSAAMAMLNWADCLAQRGKKREAADVYARLAKEHPDDTLAADALYALGAPRGTPAAGPRGRGVRRPLGAFS